MAIKTPFQIVVWANRDGADNFVVRIVAHDALSETDLVEAMITAMGDYPRADAIAV